MTELNKFSMFVIFTMGFYFLLTFPMFLAFFTMDIDTGNYTGIIYPMWLVFICALTSSIPGHFLTKYMIKKMK